MSTAKLCDTRRRMRPLDRLNSRQLTWRLTAKLESTRLRAVFVDDVICKAGMAELADAADSKSADRKVVGVRPPLPAPSSISLNQFLLATYVGLECAAE